MSSSVDPSGISGLRGIGSSVLSGPCLRTKQRSLLDPLSLVANAPRSGHSGHGLIGSRRRSGPGNGASEGSEQT